MDPVLFVISCQNYLSFQGFRLNNEGYTAYPLEQEVLLVEGCEVIVLDVQKYQLNNIHPKFAPFKGKTFTLIHAFLPDINYQDKSKGNSSVSLLND